MFSDRPYRTTAYLDWEGLAFIAAGVTVVLSAVGIVALGMWLGSANDRVIAASADPVATACAIGRQSACEVLERRSIR